MPASVIGQPLNRYEGHLKVIGAAAYTTDVHPENLAYAQGVMSPISSGEIVSIDASRAEGAPGVLCVLHPDNVPRFFRCPEELSVGEDRTPLEDRRIHYAGQFVAVVVAETPAQARWAARLVKIEYREEPPVLDLDEAVDRGDAVTVEEKSRGESDSAFARSEVQLDLTYRTPAEIHCAMEMHATLAEWRNGRLVVEDSTQWVVNQRKALAATFGLSEEEVTVRSRFIGSGFGSKLFLWPHSILAAEAARQLRRPVLLELDRRYQFTTAGRRPATRQRIRIGADRRGQLYTIIHDAVAQTSPVRRYVEACTKISRCLYACPHVKTSQSVVAFNQGTPTPMRGPGETPGLWALESALDELAMDIGMDPLELRLRNLPDRDPDAGRPWSNHTHAECLKLAAERFGWARRNPQVGSMRDGRIHLGWGLASASWPAEREAASVRVELRADGRARVACATQDIGTGTYTVFAQVVSELTGLPFDRIEVAIGDSSHPDGPVSGGSALTLSVVPVIAQATRGAVAKLLKLATTDGAPFAGRDPEALEFHAGHIGLKDGKRRVTMEQVLGTTRLAAVTDEAQSEPPEEEEHSFRSFGAHCVEVRWDPDLAHLRVSRVVTVIDAGRIINEAMARNQVHGAIMMGLGMGLMEEAIHDPRSGRVVNDNLADYLVPVHADTPKIDVTLLNRPDPHIGEFGARGIGEIGLTGVAAALASAVHHASGRRIRDLPVTVEKLLG